MKQIIEIAQRYADGLIDDEEFRCALINQVAHLQDQDQLFLLCTLLLRTEVVQ